MVLGGKAYKNLRRKGGGKYRSVDLFWVEKPIRNCDRKVLNGRAPPLNGRPPPLPGPSGTLLGESSAFYPSKG